jgi:hypothetical protein
MRWGHGCVDVFAFGLGAILGHATQTFDDRKGRADASSGGSGPIAEAVRCPLQASWRGGPKGTEGLVKPSRQCCCRLSLCGLFQR